MIRDQRLHVVFLIIGSFHAANLRLGNRNLSDAFAICLLLIVMERVLGVAGSR